MGYRAALLFALLVTLAAACASSPPAAPETPPVAAAPDASSPAASSEPAAPPAPRIACNSVDDCWVGDQKEAIRRPGHLRGKPFGPCTHHPDCVSGACAVIPSGC